ncbi:DUF2490 domain-containing protein [Segetibacter sp. 3557_3]|uniref:DUF2490 domain-containing protein n=1 Tax=Segetibacter sp. 3557_3 TaxID=2547429 RepID=UPI00140499A2|nr:DUF2490 domain-containing protein [Segetibacter sp. 3557_3]
MIKTLLQNLPRMNQVRLALLSGPAIMLSLTAGAQKNTAHQQQVWLGYFNQTRLTNKLGFWLDAHLRTKEDFFTDLSQAIGRVGVTYYINDATKLTAGYAFVNHFPADNHRNISQPEHRAWQQVQWHTKYGNKRMMQWIRLEERNRRKILNDSTLADGYSFNYRIRYNLMYEIPLTKNASLPNSTSFIINDEVHINFGKQVVYNSFDQNRFFVGFKYQVNKTDNLQFGYMNLFQQLPAGNNYRSLHTGRVFYFHNLDLRKK